MFSQEKISNAASAALVLLVLTVLSAVVIQRYSERNKELAQLDELSLETEIEEVQQETLTLRNAAQLHPVWKNWAQAKKIAKTYGLTLKSSKTKERIHRNTWVGMLSGDSLLVLAVAKKIQSRVAAEIISYQHLGTQGKLSIAVLGTEGYIRGEKR